MKTSWNSPVTRSYSLLFDKRSHSTAQPGLELILTLVPPPPCCWNIWCKPLNPSGAYIIIIYFYLCVQYLRHFVPFSQPSCATLHPISYGIYDLFFFIYLFTPHTHREKLEEFIWCRKYEYALRTDRLVLECQLEAHPQTDSLSQHALTACGSSSRNGGSHESSPFVLTFHRVFSVFRSCLGNHIVESSWVQPPCHL